MSNISKFRLKWKIFAFLLGFCALLLIILWLFQTVLLDAFYQKIRIMEIKRVSGIIVSNVGNGNIAGIIDDISESSDITVDIADLNGRSMLRPFPVQDRRTTEAYMALISLAQENGDEYYEYSILPTAIPRFAVMRGFRLPMQSLIYVRIANEATDSGIAVIINAVISPVNATVTTLRYQLYFITGIMIFLAVFLAIILAKRVSKPIEEINRGAITLAKGNYNTRFSGKGFYEIVELSETLNTAAIELGKVENLRRELLANVSHDMRTPLSLIYGYAEMMNDFPGEITPEHIKMILDETQRLASLVNDVLEISKLESDMESINISRFNLTGNILETTMRVEELLRSEGYQIIFENGEDVYANADETKINRAFYNLLVNAINYSGDNKVITVTQTIFEDCVRISVTDCGEGVAEDDLPYIWDRYYKSIKKHKRAVTGTGLGLSIVKKIIELHGGKYGVQSELGAGSTFWFEIKISV